MKSVDFCVQQQKRLLDRIDQHEKDVSSIMEAHNQLHIMHRQHLQAVLKDFNTYTDDVSLEDDVNVM